MLEMAGVAGVSSHSPIPYVTWACYDDKNGQRQYEWGQYGNDLAAMEQDFSDRIKGTISGFTMWRSADRRPRPLQYYLPNGLWTSGHSPKPPHNAPDEIVDYDRRIPVEAAHFWHGGI